MNPDLVKKVAELECLAKLLFNKGVVLRYAALAIEVAAGVMAVIVTFLQPSVGTQFWLAVFAFAMLFLAYGLKIRFSIIYDRAETMRRQAVLSNALGWDIPKVQFSVWRHSAGKNVIKQLECTTLDEDYYATKKEPGALRLLEMTQESAFWTRHLYSSIKDYLLVILAIAVGLFIAVLTFTSSATVSADVSMQIAYSVYLLMPLILTADVLGWAIKLHMLCNSIREIEKDMERLKENGTLNINDVLRLVSEYNCQVAQGFPIPNWFFSLQHDYIKNLWDKNNS
jgi:hypothetical protein